MPKLPRPSGGDLVSFLLSRGFKLARIRGSHYMIEKGNLQATVPVHGSEAVKIGTLRAILRDVEMSPADFATLWNR